MSTSTRRTGKGSEADNQRHGNKKQGSKDRDRRSDRGPRSLTDRTSHKHSGHHQHQYSAQGDNDGQMEALGEWPGEYGDQQGTVQADEYQSGYYDYSGQGYYGETGWLGVGIFGENPQDGQSRTANASLHRRNNWMIRRHQVRFHRPASIHPSMSNISRVIQHQ